MNGQHGHNDKEELKFYNSTLNELLSHFSCSSCHKMYKRKDQLNRHLKYVCHSGPSRRLACAFCRRTYKRQEHLSRHLKYECNKEPQFACPHCSYKAKRSDKMAVHVSKHNKQTTKKDTNK